jgi:hypothetical protein
MNVQQQQVYNPYPQQFIPPFYVPFPYFNLPLQESKAKDIREFMNVNSNFSPTTHNCYWYFNL